MKGKSLSRVRLLWTAAYQAPPSMGFSRQEYWSGVPLPSPRSISTSIKYSILVYHLLSRIKILLLYSDGSDGKESACHVDLASVSPWVGKISWRREWLPTPVFLPGEFHGPKSLVGYSPWGWEEYDTPEQTNNQNSDFEYHGTFYRSKLKQVSGVH